MRTLLRCMFALGGIGLLAACDPGGVASPPVIGRPTDTTKTTPPPAPSYPASIEAALSNPLALIAPHDTVHYAWAFVHRTVRDQYGTVLNVEPTIRSTNPAAVTAAHDTLIVQDTGRTDITLTIAGAPGAAAVTRTLAVTVLRPKYLATHPNGVCTKLAGTRLDSLLTVTATYRDGRYRLFPETPTVVRWWSEDTTVARIDARGVVSLAGRGGATLVWGADADGRAYPTVVGVDSMPLDVPIACPSLPSNVRASALMSVTPGSDPVPARTRYVVDHASWAPRPRP